MKHYLSIDVGGSSIKYAVIDEAVNLSYQGSLPAPKTLEEFTESICGLYERCPVEVEGIAMSLAGTINPQSGYILLAGAFPFLRGHYLRDLLKSRCPVPISVENDANSAAIAELCSGALSGVREGVAVILGSSIGGALIRDGKVFHGAHFSAGEFSLLKVNAKDDGLHHLWRNINGKNGLLRLVQERMHTDRVYTGIEIFELAEQGVAEVLDAIDEFCRLLAVQIYNVQAFADPERIAIGGGISAQPLLFERLNYHLDRIIASEAQYFLPVARPEVVPCKYRNDANLIGAFYFHLENCGEKRR